MAFTWLEDISATYAVHFISLSCVFDHILGKTSDFFFANKTVCYDSPSPHGSCTLHGTGTGHRQGQAQTQ